MTEKFPSTSKPEQNNPKDHEGYDETASEIYERYLEELGLSEGDLRDKQILDVGSGTAGFAKAVNERNIGAYVVSVEDNDLREEEPPHTKEGYVRAEAQQLPFADNTFDMVVSVHALPHVAATSKIEWGTRTGETEEGIPVYSGSKADDKKYEQELAASVAQAVRECLRVVKEGGEVRFGGVPVEKPENEFDEAGFPNLPRVIRNLGAMKGFLEGMGDDARLMKYPESDEENLFVLRKLTEAERPWPNSSVPMGTAIKLEGIDIHPEFRDVAKKFAELASDIEEAETGRPMASGEFFGQLLQPQGVVDDEGGARFPLGEGTEDYFRIPAGYWKSNQGH
jgi:ubiquinone/menaquinone biosynthesis C-methylase UbiE